MTFLSVLIALTNQTTAQNLLELIEVRLSQHETKLRAIVEEGGTTNRIRNPTIVFRYAIQSRNEYQVLESK